MNAYVEMANNELERLDKIITLLDNIVDMDISPFVFKKNEDKSYTFTLKIDKAGANETYIKVTVKEIYNATANAIYSNLGFAIQDYIAQRLHKAISDALFD